MLGGGELKNDSAPTLVVTKLAHINLCLCSSASWYNIIPQQLTSYPQLPSSLIFAVRGKEGRGAVFTIEGGQSTTNYGPCVGGLKIILIPTSGNLTITTKVTPFLLKTETP